MLLSQIKDKTWLKICAKTQRLGSFFLFRFSPSRSHLSEKPPNNPHPPNFPRFPKKSLRFINPIWWWMWNYFYSPSDGIHRRLPGKPGIQATGLPDFRGKTCWTPTRFPSLKLTASKRPWKWMVGRWTFLFGARPILRGELLVSGRVTFKMLFSSNIFSPPEHVKNARNVPQAGL